FEEGRGPLVLLLHGFPDTAHTWDAVRPALAGAGFRAFMRGYAPTEIPDREAYDADTLGRDALALIEALGEEKAFLVGHDWGATAAFSAAGLAPERLRMLITVAIPPSGVDRTDPPHPLGRAPLLRARAPGRGGEDPCGELRVRRRARAAL